DFHALRHTFITRLVRAGVKPKEAQALARHSTITLTMDRYAHTGLHDVAAAVEALPNLPSEGPEAGRQALRATGTDPVGLPLVCTGFAQTTDTGRPSLRPDGTSQGDGKGTECQTNGGRKGAISQGVATTCDGVRLIETAEGAGFEPARGLGPLSVFKTDAFGRSSTPPVCLSRRRHMLYVLLRLFVFRPDCWDTATGFPAPQEAVHDLRGLLLHPRQDVGVGVQGDLDRPVPQPLRHHLRVYIS